MKLTHAVPRKQAVPRKRAVPFDLASFLAVLTTGKSSRAYHGNQTVFSQGDRADAVFYVQSGKVKLTAMSALGKEAVVAVLERGTFFGESCLAGQPLRMSTARTLRASFLVRIAQKAMAALLRREPKFAELFTAHLLLRNVRIEEDLIDQLFNSSEKRLARVLLLLAHFGGAAQPEPVIPRMNQATLASMVGIPRSKVGYFMRRFRRLGFIDYRGGALAIHSGLLNVVLHD